MAKKLKSLNRRGPPPVLFESALAQILKDWIVPHESGFRLPVESDLAEQYGVSRKTIRAVFDHLSLQGQVIRKIRRGTFVAGPLGTAWSEYFQCQLGLVFGQLHSAVANSFSNAIQGSITRRLQHTGMGLLICTCDWRHWSTRDAADYFRSNSVKGIFLIDRPPPRVLQALLALHKPVVAIEFDAGKGPICSIQFDNYSAGVALSGRLELLRHRRILAIFESDKKPLKNQDESWHLRRDGFLAGFSSKANVEIERIYLPKRAFGQDLNLRLAKILKRPVGKRPTAVMIPGSQFLEPLREVATACGLGIPKDLTVLGFASSLESTDLTAIRFDPGELGIKAVDYLLRRVVDEKKKKTPPIHALVKGRYVAGGTHAPRLLK